jgi:hypothetical protein
MRAYSQADGHRIGLVLRYFIDGMFSARPEADAVTGL